MGLMQHHAIVATTWNKEHFEAARNWIDKQGWADAFLFGEPKINRERTLFHVGRSRIWGAWR